MKNIKKVLALALASSMVLSFAACGNEPATNNSTGENSSVTESSTTSEVSEKTGNQWDNTTYMDYLSASPKTWNRLEWETSTDEYIMNYINSQFWGYTLNETGDGYEVYCDAAAKLPEDVTEEYAGKEEWGIPADAKNGDGWAYKVTLRDDLCWEDGTPIHAVDFVETMKRLLDPEMKCYRGSEFYESTVSFVNAKNYYWQGEKEDTVPVEWDQVGLKATGENELTYILSKPCNSFYITSYDGSLPLVRAEIYDKSIEKTGDIKKSKYCTSFDTTASWGQFKLVEYQEDKSIRLEKNDKWYGWSDPNYEGRYWLSFDAVDCEIIKEHATALQLFLQGKLDKVGLTANEMKTYGASDYLHLEPSSQTASISFNGDYERLKSFETEGYCKVMPTYIEFRKAFSRMMNRKEYVATCTSCSIPAFGLFNRIYVADPIKGTIYRDTPRAQQALLNTYTDGKGSVDEITGYDVEEARELFQQAYEKAVANGDYKDGEIIEIKFMMESDSEDYQKTVNHIEEKFQEALKGTGFEGKGKITLVADEDFWGKLYGGNFEATFTYYYGATMNGPIMLGYWTDNEWRAEYGFNPNEEKFTGVVDGKEYTMTYKDWTTEILDGMWANAAPEVKCEAWAVVEEAILLQYRAIPIYSSMKGQLLSHRLSYEVEEYIPLIGFGKSAMSMNDEEWAKYVADNGGKLDY